MSCAMGHGNWKLIYCFYVGIAIALAHDGKTRQELASELTHLEENSDKSQESESTAESASVPVEKTVTLNKMRSSNFYVSIFPPSLIVHCVILVVVDGKQSSRRNCIDTPVLCLRGKNWKVSGQFELLFDTRNFKLTWSWWPESFRPVFYLWNPMYCQSSRNEFGRKRAT